MWVPFYISIYPEVAYRDKEIGKLLQQSNLQENEAMIIWILFQMNKGKDSP